MKIKEFLLTKKPLVLVVLLVVLLIVMSLIFLINRSTAQSKRATLPVVIEPVASYSLDKNPVLAGSDFTILVKTNIPQIEGPAFLVDGQPVQALSNNPGEYIFTNGHNNQLDLAVGTHIIQLVGGCINKSDTVDCSKASLGFNPYFLKVVDTIQGSTKTSLKRNTTDNSKK